MSAAVKHAPLACCPFCGKAPTVRRTVEEYDADEQSPAGEYDAHYHIQCDTCGIEQSEEYRDEAIALWNRRAPDPVREKLVEALEACARTLSQHRMCGATVAHDESLAAVEEMVSDALSLAKGEQP